MSDQSPSPAGQPGEPVDPRAADPLHHAGPVRTCKWCSTSTRVIWVKSKAKGKGMPIEVGVNPKGNVEIVYEPDPRTGSEVALAIVHGSEPGMVDEWVPYMPHHATCLRNVKGARS